eukprot:CAMPEP_0174996534 /NCGR_PEP_ID=MMETSP0005-20121125/447_1 /TAXON_ID=420556 /ORGANISM="Ochromonas sp., Strain CCMP1393" /LENGTH=335 /DNA_ID=CAMNT_0016250951 /DNA_START=57 /DNA_END=1064 /DNA_ORIENTATION=+
MALSRDRTLKENIAETLISGAFKIKPLFKIASKKARDSMVERGSKIGVDWTKNIAEYQENISFLEDSFAQIQRQETSYPEYYLKPFHAYDEGNLSWQAAMEVESAAITVHAQIYNQTPDELDKRGDFTLRDNFHRNMEILLLKKNFSPRRVLDIGCSTGLSTLKLHETFPSANIVGIDLSPHMLAVAEYQLSRGAASRLGMSYRNEAMSSAKDSIEYLHRAGEDTGLGKGDVDLVTMSLVSHELPQAATRDILLEAYRILPSGGAFVMMDMNPESPAFQRISSNPFAFAAFKSTEPWIQEYATLDLYSTMRECGFTDIDMLQNSPRHRTVIGFKP